MNYNYFSMDKITNRVSKHDERERKKNQNWIFIDWIVDTVYSVCTGVQCLYALNGWLHYIENVCMVWKCFPHVPMFNAHLGSSSPYNTIHSISHKSRLEKSLTSHDFFIFHTYIMGNECNFYLAIESPWSKCEREIDLIAGIKKGGKFRSSVRWFWVILFANTLVILSLKS